MVNKMAENKTNNEFKAKCNVNIMLDLTKYQEVRDYVEAEFKRMSLFNPNISKNNMQHLYIRELPIKTIITVGDKMKINEHGHVEVYPKEMFDNYSMSKVDVPSQLAGNIRTTFEQTLSGMTTEDKQEYEKKRAVLTARYTPTPMMSRVA